MKKKRIISMNSRAKLYHRAECRYVKQIKIKNRMEISRSQAEELGYCIVVQLSRHKFNLFIMNRYM